MYQDGTHSAVAVTYRRNVHCGRLVQGMAPGVIGVGIIVFVVRRSQCPRHEGIHAKAGQGDREQSATIHRGRAAQEDDGPRAEASGYRCRHGNGDQRAKKGTSPGARERDESIERIKRESRHEMGRNRERRHRAQQHAADNFDAQHDEAERANAKNIHV